MLNEGGKIIKTTHDYCIIEKLGLYYQIDSSGNVEVIKLLCD